MLSYQTTMRVGASRYQDVLDALYAAGLPGGFIQTGGMNAALLVHVDGGRVLLVTDADGALSWDRDDQNGWGVGLYPDDTLEGGPEVFASGPDNDSAALITLIGAVLRQFRRTRRVGPECGGLW